MEKEIEKLVNVLYQQWLKEHDPFEDDFEDELLKLIPAVKMSLNYNTQANSSEWIFICYTP